MDAVHAVWPYFIALAPSVGVGFLFYVVIKNMIEGDRKERIAHAQWEAEHPDEAAPTPVTPTGTTTTTESEGHVRAE